VTRRALSSLAPPTEQSGDAAIAATLFRALERCSSEPADTLTHPFHSYPARMHPSIAREVVAAFAGDVLDPFCGSGTVLVESLVAGRRSFGSDLNPIALRIAETKTRLMDAGARTRFVARARDIAERARDRTRKRARARAPIGKKSAALFDPHVLVALATVWDEIRADADDDDRRSLEAVFSSLLTKLSRRRGDSAETETTKRIGRFLAADLFERRAQELAQQWELLFAAAPRDAHLPRLRLEDARSVDRIGRKLQLVLTSPPYGGTYDYASHHALRVEWLGLDDRELRRLEIGARRRSTTDRWDDELGAVVAAIARVLAPQGIAVLLLGDAELDGKRIDARAHVARIAAPLSVRATASAPRPDWRGGAPRAEHLIALGRSR
jgi:SAM-dependent methyltransferase